MVDKIKTLARNRRGISLQQLAEKCGIGINSIYRWDVHRPSADKVKKVARYLGTTVEYLLEDENHDYIRNKSKHEGLAYSRGCGTGSEM